MVRSPLGTESCLDNLRSLFFFYYAPPPLPLEGAQRMLSKWALLSVVHLFPCVSA